MDYKKIQKFFFNHKEYLIIKKLNKENKITYFSSADSNTKLEGKNRIGRACIRGAEIGYATYIGSGIFEKCKIGRFCSIGDNVLVVSSTHPIHFLSTHPCFFNSYYGNMFDTNLIVDEFIKTNKGFYCEIGNDVWIGQNVLIKGGIKIGDGSIIGMGSVVTKDVEPYSIVAGNPAKIIKYRFSKEIIDSLLKLNIWENYKKYMNDILLYFDKPDKFIEFFIKKNV